MQISASFFLMPFENSHQVPTDGGLHRFMESPCAVHNDSCPINAVSSGTVITYSPNSNIFD